MDRITFSFLAGDRERHWSVPHPRGESSIKLYNGVVATLKLCDMPDFQLGSEAAVTRLTRALCYRQRQGIILETLDGATVDEAPVTAEDWASLFDSCPSEPYLAALNVWIEAGFFTVPRLVLRGAGAIDS